VRLYQQDQSHEQLRGWLLRFLKITLYALIAHRNLAERARLLTLHSAADGRLFEKSSFA
jgi:hypothetical protein